MTDKTSAEKTSTDAQKEKVYAGGTSINVTPPPEVVIEQPDNTKAPDLTKYAYFGKRLNPDSAGNSLITPWRLKIADATGKDIPVPDGYVSIPVTNQEELREFMAKTPYFDKNGALQYGYAPPKPNAQEQAKVIYTQLKESAVNGLPVGASPSPEAVSYAKDLQNIINPPVQKTTEAFVLASTSTETKSESAPVVNEVTLPTPPFPLSELNNFNSGWWK
ncbi:hypothetical protein FAI40_09990 [Acetobacteraceae bacterium]|nr:hypothetical protein FAI40_09990 [Acetobacteraceae bacterium]